MLGIVGMLAAWRLVDVAFYPLFWMVVQIIYPNAMYG
jgi:hypothetical protein